MNIRPLYTKVDTTSINRWLGFRNAPVITRDDLPAMSFIIPGVAACGIRRCEGNVAILDSLVTNPYVSKHTRNKALDALFEYVLNHSGFKRIIGFTIDNNTHERALKHGFKQLQYSLYSYSKG